MHTRRVPFVLTCLLLTAPACGTSTGGGGFAPADVTGGAADTTLSFDALAGDDAALSDTTKSDTATSDSHADTVLSDAAKVCAPTESKACICVTGAMGVQVCKPDQSGWGLCTCGASDAFVLSDGSGLNDTGGGGGGGKDGGGGGGKDGGGGGKDGGGGAGGDGGGGGGDGGGGKEACEQLNCPTEWGACQADSGCVTLLACKKACKGDKTCAGNCDTAAPPASVSLEKALADCGKTNGCGGGGGGGGADAVTVD